MNAWLFVFVLCAAVSPASAGPKSAQQAPASSGTTHALTPQAVNAHYAALVYATYADTWRSAKVMQAAIAAFLSHPSAHGLQSARQTWVEAREFYGQTEAFRFYGGPIDDRLGREGRINAWPVDESFIDGVRENPGKGLVNDRGFLISKQSLSAQNQRGGEENVATGWHAIEFLLWGQDLDEAGPGNRSFEDYVDGKVLHAQRRRHYLKVVTELLIDDLGALVRAWAPQRRGNFRSRFERGGAESLHRTLVGLGSLSRGELAGERLEVALASQDQEDEQSCFSDNTHRDVVANALGIENVWLGRYVRSDGSVLRGPSLRDLVAARDAALAERATKHFAASVAAARAIQAPFDREVVGGKDAPGRQRIQAVIDSLIEQSKDLVLAAQVLNIPRLTAVPR